MGLAEKWHIRICSFCLPLSCRQIMAVCLPLQQIYHSATVLFYHPKTKRFPKTFKQKKNIFNKKLSGMLLINTILGLRTHSPSYAFSKCSLVLCVDASLCWRCSVRCCCTLVLVCALLRATCCALTMIIIMIIIMWSSVNLCDLIDKLERVFSLFRRGNERVMAPSELRSKHKHFNSQKGM